MVKRPTRPITRVSNSNSLISITPFYIGLSKRRGYVNRKFSLPEERPATYPPFMADSRGETPQGYCSGYADRLQRSYVSLRCLLPSRLPARESNIKPALWSSLPSGSFLLYPPLVSPAGGRSYVLPTPWSRLPARSVRGRAPLALAHPLPCTHRVEEDSLPAWEGEKVI